MLSVRHRTSVVSPEMYWVSCIMYSTTILTVVVEDMLSFYVLFEAMLVVMTSTVSLYWYSSRSTYAISMLVAYTVLGSSLLGVSMMMVYCITGCVSSMHTITSSSYGTLGTVCCLLMHVAFYTKIPSAPLHHWLLEAHVESSTEGSIVLAGVYLKVGVLGWYRYAVWGNTLVTMYTLPLAGVCMLLGTSSCVAVVVMSLDTKRFAASCSVLHLQVCILSLLLIHHVLLSVGSMLQVVLHSWIASLLFL